MMADEPVGAAVLCERCRRPALSHPSFAADASAGAAGLSLSPLAAARVGELAAAAAGAGGAAGAANNSAAAPLCADCSHAVAEELLRQLLELKAQNQAYADLERQLQADRETPARAASAGDELTALQREEAALRAELSQLQMAAGAAERERAALAARTGELALLEQTYWAAYAELQLQTHAFEEDSGSLGMRLKHAQAQLARLKKSHVLNDAFHIWHEGQFGTINGFRLGRLPSQPVDWAELNAALGQTCLLLEVLGRRAGLQFQSFRPLPCGSCSRVQDLREDTAYELFGSSDVSLSRLFWYRRFDKALHGLLDCTRQLAEHAHRNDATFVLPHPINLQEDSIGGVNLKLQFNSDLHWTKALKYLLTNLKWLMAKI